MFISARRWRDNGAPSSTSSSSSVAVFSSSSSSSASFVSSSARFVFLGFVCLQRCLFCCSFLFCFQFFHSFVGFLLPHPPLPTGSCRFGQHHHFLRPVTKKHCVKNPRRLSSHLSAEIISAASPLATTLILKNRLNLLPPPASSAKPSTVHKSSFKDIFIHPVLRAVDLSIDLGIVSATRCRATGPSVTTAPASRAMRYAEVAGDACAAHATLSGTQASVHVHLPRHPAEQSVARHGSRPRLENTTSSSASLPLYHLRQIRNDDDNDNVHAAADTSASSPNPSIWRISLLRHQDPLMATQPSRAWRHCQGNPDGTFPSRFPVNHCREMATLLGRLTEQQRI